MTRRLLLPLFCLFVCGSAVATTATDERLLALARQEAPGEVQLHVIKVHERLSGFTAKVRSVEPVPGWRQIRARGEAAFAAWDQHKRDFVWRSGAFEVLWDLSDRDELVLNSVTFDGQTRRAEP